MAEIQAERRFSISSIHRSLLIAASISTVLLIAMGWGIVRNPVHPQLPRLAWLLRSHHPTS